MACNSWQCYFSNLGEFETRCFTDDFIYYYSRGCYMFFIFVGRCIDIFFSCTKNRCIFPESRTKADDDHAQKSSYSQKHEIRSLKSRDPEETRRKSLRRIEFPFLRVILNAPNWKHYSSKAALNSASTQQGAPSPKTYKTQKRFGRRRLFLEIYVN